MVQNATHDSIVDFLAPLGLMLPITVEDVKQAYLAKVKKAHPDVGGDVEHFKQLQRAYEEAHEYAQSHGIAWLGSSVDLYVAQQQLIDTVKELGGRVDIEDTGWIKREVGEDFAHIFERVIGIHLRGPQIDDEVLGCLVKNRQALASLRVLDLTASHITYRGLELVKRLPKLRWLRLQRTHVTWWRRFKLWWFFPNLTVVIS